MAMLTMNTDSALLEGPSRGRINNIKAATCKINSLFIFFLIREIAEDVLPTGTCLNGKWESSVLSFAQASFRLSKFISHCFNNVL